MTSYRYRAARADGRMSGGRIEAATAEHAGFTLLGRGLYPVSIDEAPMRTKHASASSKDLAIVFRSIASLVTAGVPLERAVTASEPLARGPLRPFLMEARRLLREGKSLGQALEMGGMVPAVVTGMVRAGERGSQLASALEQAAAHLEYEAELTARLRQALAYPLLLAASGTVSVIVIGTVVVPRFASLLTELGQSLPLSTRILLAGSAFLRESGLALIAIALALAVVVGNWLRQPSGQLVWHTTLIRVPVIGTVRHGLATARLCRALGGMLAAGMPVLQALDGAREAAADRAVAERVVRARERIVRGEPLAASLSSEQAVTPTAVQMLLVGEGSGQLGAMAERAGILAAAEAERSLRTALTLLEPTLIVVFGGAVALVAVALLQAVYSVRLGG